MNSDKLHKLRKVLANNNIDGFLFSTNDEYINEYVSDSSKRLEFLTNFSGSYGICVVLENKVAVFVDSRYHEQAKQEIDLQHFTVLDLSILNITNFLKQYASPLDKIAINSRITTINEFNLYTKIFQEAKVTITKASCHFIDDIWDNKKVAERKEIYLHKEEYGSDHYTKKIEVIVSKIQENKLNCILITALDDIAWLLNLRGNDICYNPVFFSKLILTKNYEAILFVDKEKLSDSVSSYLKDQVVIKSEIEFEDYLLSLVGSIGLNVKTPVFYLDFLNQNHKQTQIVDNFCALPKSIKNLKEQESILDAHIREGIALTKLLYLVHTQAKIYSELSLEEQLIAIISKDSKYKEPSFAPIIAVDENSALPHYRSNKRTCKNIEKNSYLLIDCGFQYFDATTDMTRTISLGDKSKEFCKHYTLVLKGHIAIAELVFKKGLTGSKIDPLARKYLWQEGLDFGHGTGHGVGFALCVHESPVAISPLNEVKLEAGMVLSNEPGFYLSDNYGIRLENLLVVKQASNEEFLYFDFLTMVPFDVKNIDVSLMDAHEILWLQRYHAKVFANISSNLTTEEKEWFLEYTKLPHEK